MGTKINKVTQFHITTDEYQISYDSERGVFELVISRDLETEGGPIGLHVFLDDKVVRQMYDALPPIEPESVH